MMSVRPVGKTLTLSVGGTAHAAATLGSDCADYCSKIAIVNTGTTTVALQIVRLADAGSQPAVALASDGALSAVVQFLVAPSTTQTPVIYDTPPMPVSITAIGSASGPSVLYVTPCEGG